MTAGPAPSPRVPAVRSRGGARRLLRLLAAPATAILLLVGIWVAGGLLTNDFALAMRLTALWIVLAGIAALVVGWRARSVRWPVLGAYAVTVALVGAYLGSATLMDREVNEVVATAPAAPAPASAPGSAAAPPAPANVRLAAGAFEPVRHAAAGQATAIELAEGGRVLTLTGFEVDNGPDLRLYLVAGPAAEEGQVSDLVDLGALKGNRGNQQYELPASLDLERYSTVVVWCRAFSVLFARAPLKGATA